MWDVKEVGLEIEAVRQWRGHTSVVEDVDWHKHDPFKFGSVGDDSQLLIWDVRAENPTHIVKGAHNGDVNSISFNPFSEYLLATGGSDHVVGLWDLRNMSQKIHKFEGHHNGVYQVKACACYIDLLVYEHNTLF